VNKMTGSGIARLSYEQLSPRLQSLLKSKVERLGYLGEFFQCTGHQPDILASFLEMTDHLKSALDDRWTELGALTVASFMDNHYELFQHERLSRKLGFDAQWIAAVEKLDPDGVPEFSGADRAAQKFALVLLEHKGTDASAELETLIEAIGPDQAIAFIFLVGRYMSHAMIVNALKIQPPVKSIFEEDTP